MPRQLRTVQARHLVSVYEICKLAGGVPRSTLARWRRGTFPKRVRKLAIGEVFDLAEVRPWLVAREIAETLRREHDAPTAFRRVVPARKAMYSQHDPGLYEILLRGEVYGRIRVDAKGEGEWV